MDFDALKNKAQDLISNVTGGSDAEPDQEKRDRGDQPSGVDQGYTDPGYQDQDQPGRMGQGGYQDTPGGFDQGGYRDQPGGLGQGGYQDTSGGFDQPGGYGGDPGVQGQGGYEDRSGALDQSGYPEQGRYGDAAGGGYDTGQGESGPTVTTGKSVAAAGVRAVMKPLQRDVRRRGGWLLEDQDDLTLQ